MVMLSDSMLSSRCVVMLSDSMPIGNFKFVVFASDGVTICELQSKVVVKRANQKDNVKGEISNLL
jgi:hypothetical protein